MKTRSGNKLDLRWGIDIGGVLMAADTDTSFFGPDYLSTPEVKGAIQTIEFLCDEFGSSNVYLVSKCSEATEKRTLEWLAYRHFYAISFERDNILLCRSREEKARLCIEYALSAFIDDRFSVLYHMLPNPQMRKLFLFSPAADELALFRRADAGRITLVDHWFWINSHLLFDTSPPFPLPPRWWLVADSAESDVLSKQFLRETGCTAADANLESLRCIARNQDDIILQSGPNAFTRFYLTWSKEITPNPSAETLPTMTLTQLVDLMKDSSVASTWPPRGFTLDRENKRIIEETN